MTKVPWEEVRERYEKEKVSIRQLAAEYGITARAISYHVKKEGWKRGERIPTTAEACVASTMKQLAKQLSRVENGEEVSMGEIKELTAVLKDLVKVKESLEENDGGEEKTVRVEMSEEIEAWSK